MSNQNSIEMIMRTLYTHVNQDKLDKYDKAIDSIDKLIELEKKKTELLGQLRTALELKRVKLMCPEAETAYLMTYSERVIPDTADGKYTWVKRNVWTVDRIEVNDKQGRNHKYRNFDVKSYKLPEEA